MDWITNHIAIGNFLDAKEHSTEFDAMLCLKQNCCDSSQTLSDVFCLPLIDGPGNRPSDIIAAVQYLADCVNSGEKVLVHCHAGRSRSVAVVARYLMHSRGITKFAAISFIAEKREICMSIGIDEILDAVICREQD